MQSFIFVCTVDTNQSITKGQFRTTTICRQAADIAWYPFGHEYQAILFPNSCCANLALVILIVVHASVMSAHAAIFIIFGGRETSESGLVQQVSTAAMQRKGTASRCRGKWHF